MGLIYSDGSPLKWSKIQRDRDSSAPFDEVVTLQQASACWEQAIGEPGKNTGPSVLQPQVPDFCPKRHELKEVSIQSLRWELFSKMLITSIYHQECQIQLILVEWIFLFLHESSWKKGFMLCKAFPKSSQVLLSLGSCFLFCICVIYVCNIHST